jgi:Glycosyl transferase 4-like domain
MVTSEWPDSDNPHWAPFIVRQVEFLRKAGVDVDLLPFRGAKNPINYLRAWLEVRRKLRPFSYDLVPAQWAQSALTVLPTRLPLVVTFRGGEVKGIVGSSGNYTALGYMLRAVSGFVAWRADELIVVSSEMRKYLPRRHSHVVPSGLDFSMFSIVSQDEARRKLGLPLSKRLVLFVGNPASPLKRYALAKEIVGRLDRELEAEWLSFGAPAQTRAGLYECMRRPSLHIDLRGLSKCH